MSKRIGEILAVSGINVTIEVDSNLSDLHVRHAGKTYTVGQPGSYLLVDRGHDKYLILVTTVRKTRWNAGSVDYELPKTENFKEGLPKGHSPFLPKPQELIDRTLIDGILVGTIIGKKFEIGVMHLPIVGDDVTLALQDHLSIALAPAEERHTISIGTFVDSSIPVHLDMDDLLGKHSAIVGTTGCGKSYAVARLLQEIVSNYPSANIIVFDLHGEYRNCFTPCNYIRADQLSLPAWLHSFDNLFDLCADLSNQFNIHNQRWAFRDGIFQLKQRYCKDILNDEELSKNIDLDSPIPFDFNQLVNYLKNLNNETLDSNDKPAYNVDGEHDIFKELIAYKPKERSKISGGTLNGELDRLVLRVESRYKDPRYSFVFQYPSPKKGDLEKLIRNVTGFMIDSPSPITVYDLSYLPSETVGAVVATISRIIFQVHFLSKKREFVPSLIVYEEAHNYISHRGRGAYGDAREAAERIAKEGRKFGIGMLAVSQRPSELSETMLSQCNTFLCMRLANTVDKNHILSLLPDSMSNLIDILPILPRGHILAVGQATKMPVRTIVTQITDKTKEPDSNDPAFGEKWKVAIDKRKIPDIEKICDKWIRSEKLLE